MIIPLEPALEGLAERRFLGFARQVLDRQAAGDQERISALVAAETEHAARLRELKGQRDEYTACVRVLGDLAQLRWELVDSGHGLELHSPRPHEARTSAPYEVRLRKQAIRNELRPRVLQQFADPHVRRFIRRLERPKPSSKHKSIKTLIAEGAELQQRLRAARDRPLNDPGRTEVLRAAVHPYLQLVDSGVRDEHTGIPLRDIWRYFRFTWSIPQTPIPGRSLVYLIRDEAHEHHAVIGIAALSNCAVQMVPRDRAIGWSAAGLASALTTLFSSADQRRAREANDPSLGMQGVYRWLLPLFPAGTDPSPETMRNALERVADWLLEGIATAIGEIEHQGLATPEDLATPTQETIDWLRHLSREFAARRQEALSRSRDDSDVVAGLDPDAAGAPVDDDVLDLEAKHASNPPVNNSRRMLVRKKRAFELARLLDASRVLAASREALTDPASAFAAMEREEIRAAINTAMSAIKGRRIGTNLLEITTCGAVAPYNRMLGGKLVALLLLSPQVATDNNRRYGAKPAIIRSQLKNIRVVPDSTLVWLGTTSLFSHGSSQYERLRLPAGTIAPDQQEIRYSYLGETTGYGTVQFADDTVRALDSVMRRRRGYRDVNSVFGEGASPRLRKLRSGLDAIGFNASLTMLHHQGRRIYGVPLFPAAGAYLCGFDPDVPDYIRSPESCLEASERIAEFWRCRWLSRRLEHEDSWTALGETGPWLLSSTIPDEASPKPSPAADDGDDGDGADDDQRADDEAELEFWRRLARGGPNAVSEGLTDDDYERLHLATPLEDHLLAQARQGRPIVLTGNAGDGKTHLARTLQRRLGSDADRFVFEFDATAIMTNRDGVAPIIESWRRASNDSKSMVLAINQYPLHMLRQELRSALPAVSDAIDRQWRARLHTEPSDDSSDPGDLLLVDLSLRNPLSQHFSKRVLNKMLESPAVRRYAARHADANFSLNFRCLSHSEVQTRLFHLFARVVSSGGRATIRELWILCARLLFGASEDAGFPGSHQTWYSDRLFERDARFPLTGALCRVADPAQVSHPQIDRRLEDPRGTRAVDWLIDGEPPDLPASPVALVAATAQDRNRHQARFAARKRRFYFEHTDGGEARVFALDDSSHANFHRMLRTDTRDDEYRRVLIEAINRCYFLHDFDGMRDKLCLWIGHRLDEQPTKSFVADECVPLGRLALKRPAPPAALRDNLDYVPDHLLLSLKNPGGAGGRDLSLRIDPALFHTLWSIRGGLPRHLINPAELNRLDTFIDRLRRASPPPERLPEFLIYNAEHVASSAVKLSADRTRYDRVDRLPPEGRT